MNKMATLGRYKILWALMGGVLLTSAAAWLPILIEELGRFGLPHTWAAETAYGLFFIVAAGVSYVFVRELIKAKLQTERCGEVLHPSTAFELHDKQLFHSMAQKQILLAKRNKWPVCMAALYLQPISESGSRDVSREVKELAVKEFETTVRGSDLVVSFTRNEYLMFFPNCTLEKGKEVIDRIYRRLADKEMTIGDKVYRIECKCGLTSMKPDAVDLKALSERAFRALDRIKGKSGNYKEVYG
ncbi:GGDEF domain-containing protein [Hydrogenimonas sp.]